MSIEITAVRNTNSAETQGAIGQLAWRNDITGATGTATIATVVEFIDRNDIAVYVGAGDPRDRVVAIHPSQGEAFLRTRIDDRWTDALHALPLF